MIPKKVADAVLAESASVPNDAKTVAGINFDECPRPSLDDILERLATSGFQATHLGRAIEVVKSMLDWRYDEVEPDEEHRRGERCKIWLSFTSNMISSGLREIFVYLAKHKLVDVIVTSAGGVEEDLIKCMGETYIGDFAADGSTLRNKGWNRIGNLFVPNRNYCIFEEWVQPQLDKMLEEQKHQGTNWTPSKIIHRLGESIHDETSLCYWCHRNDIPIFCPGITDGALGDNMFFHSYRNPGLKVDVVEDMRLITDFALKRCKRSGVIILGGGVAKHHTCNANLMRNGADYAVYINTANEFDGCDSGASPDEAVSWGKIKGSAEPVKVNADATIAFPLLVAATFVKFKKE